MEKNQSHTLQGSSTATEPRLSLDMELKAKQESDLEALTKELDCKEYKYEFNQFEAEADDEDTVAIRAEVSTPVFFYHPDHLGTSTVISNSAGAVHQYFFNLPFGETMIEGCTNTSYELNYKFNAKELDAESGLYYYGARYYDPRISVWMSVDPMWDKYRSFTPYAYCGNSPIIYIDPDGMRRTKFGVTDKGDVRQIGKADDKPDELYAITENNKLKSTKHVTVNDKTILPELAKDRNKTVERDGVGSITQQGILSYATSSNKKEIANIFLFVSKNSKAEWALYTSKNNDKRSYTLGTLGLDNHAPSITNLNLIENSVTSMIHSHVNNFDQNSEHESMWGDKLLSPVTHYKYYMFGSETNNFYEVTKLGTSNFIEKINAVDQLYKYMK